MESSFPPPLIPGNRVWTVNGYHQHGPVGGPKVDIAPGMGGVIAEVESLPFSDICLYAIRWDNGQTSTHYAKGLFCIGRFAGLAEFKAAIEVEHVRISLGPWGGFQGAEIRLRYDGVLQQSQVPKSQEAYWIGLLDEIAERQGAEIETVVLPRSKSS